MKNIQETGDGFVAEIRDLSLRVDKELQTVLPEDVSTLNDALTSIINALNGRLTFGDLVNGNRAGNFDAQWIKVTFPSVANTEQEVFHGLNRTPQGYSIGRKDRAADVYDSNPGAWTSTKLMLKSSVASAVVWVKVF